MSGGAFFPGERQCPDTWQGYAGNSLIDRSPLTLLSEGQKAMKQQKNRLSARRKEREQVDSSSCNRPSSGLTSAAAVGGSLAVELLKSRFGSQCNRHLPAEWNHAGKNGRPSWSVKCTLYIYTGVAR